MDKSVGRDKRRKDKHHKKPPPVKSSSGNSTSKANKESDNRTVNSPVSLIGNEDSYPRRPIESNWGSSRNISSGESDSEDEQLRAADFEKLLQMPPSVSGHFFLSTEKHWTADSEAIISCGSGKSEVQWGQYFRIDTKQLNACLATIPLYERNCYPCEIFSKQEIESMNLKAHYELKKYDEFCERLETSKKMGDNQPNPPVKCLIGTQALPPHDDAERQDPSVRPTPCLIGPMALPPELQNDPSVTGSLSCDVPVVELLDSVNITESDNAFADTVPIGDSSIDLQPESAVGEMKKGENSDRQEGAKSVAKETKEDIQQWLDDILEM